MCKAFKVIAVSGLMLMSAVAAHAGEWTVTRSSGQVRVIHDGATAAALGPDGKVRAGDRIVTGANGRVMLKRGAESIIIAPGTELIVPLLAESPGRTTLLQSRGRAEFDVEKRNVQHFEVETPFLAAVVKGTHFVVDVGAQGAVVSVDRGIVEVFDLDTGQVGLVKAGQRAATRSVAGAGLELAGTGIVEALQQRSPRKSRIDMSQPAEREANLDRDKAMAKQAVNAQRQTARAEALPVNASPRAVVAVGRGIKITQPVGERVIKIKAVSRGLAQSPRARRAELASDETGKGGGNGNGLALGVGNSGGNGNSGSNSGSGLRLAVGPSAAGGAGGQAVILPPGASGKGRRGKGN